MSEKHTNSQSQAVAFWCMVKPFDELPGIHKVLSGYAGGHVETQHMNK